MEDLRKIIPEDEQADFVMSFVREASDKRRPMEEIWEETERNFLVQPLTRGYAGTADPLDRNRDGALNQSGYSILKDPESHQEAMTIIAKIMGTIFPEGDFVRAKNIGWEDVQKSSNVSKLCHYIFRNPEHYLTGLEWLMSTAIYGTGHVESYWDYCSGPRVVRQFDQDPFTGQTTETQSIADMVIYDDVRIMPVDIRDVYRDFGCSRLSMSRGVAKRFRIDAMEAMRRAQKGMYDMAKTKEAISSAQKMDAQTSMDKPSNLTSDLSSEVDQFPDFLPLVGYEYFGQIPFMVKTDVDVPEYALYNAVITVLAGKTVRADIWPRGLPIHECKIIPRLGSPYGIAPLEIIRTDQDFVDVLKMMLADAVVRMAHPPPVYSKDADVDVRLLRKFAPDVPIGARSVEDIQLFQYNPQVAPAFSMSQGTKGSMREGTGALGAVQGLGLGTKRFSGTEAAETFKAAYDRPELYASVVEKVYLPPLAKYGVSLYQEMLPADDPMELQKRIGQSAYPVTLADIQLDYDIEFVGSRVEGSKAELVQAYREIFQASSNPIVNQIMPWIPFLRMYFDKMGATEIAAMVGNPMLIQLNTMLSQLGQPAPAQGNGNGEIGAGAPPGMLPAQTMGGPQYG